MKTKEVSGISKEFVASSIKAQVNRCNRFLSAIENDEPVDGEYVNSWFKEAENSLRQVRKEWVH